MFPFASIIPPSQSTPEPQIPNWLTLITSASATLLCLAFIVLISSDFVMDWFGKPLSFRRELDIPDTVVENETPEKTLGDRLQRYTLVAPKNQTRFVGNNTVILITWKPETPSDKPPLILPDLWVDDYLIPYDKQFGNSTWFAVVPLLPGQHHLRTPAVEGDFFVESTDDMSKQAGPTDWTFVRPHPETDQPDRCGVCHEITPKATDLITQRQALTVGKWKGVESCTDCHKKDEMLKAHQKPARPVDACLECHTIH